MSDITPAEVIPLRPGQVIPSRLADPLAGIAIDLVRHLGLVPLIKSELAAGGVLDAPELTDSNALATALSAAIWGWTSDELGRTFATPAPCD